MILKALSFGTCFFVVIRHKSAQHHAVIAMKCRLRPDLCGFGILDGSILVTSGIGIFVGNSITFARPVKRVGRLQVETDH